jgi:hypothetical protein
MHINTHKIMNTHINTYINNINTHNLYLRWRAARRWRDERAGSAGTATRRVRGDGAAGTAEGPGVASRRAPEWGAAACSGRTAAARGRRGGGQRKARRRAAGATAGREEEESVREEKGERRTVENFIF